MSDVLERLRGLQEAAESDKPFLYVKDIYRLAADEIERLRTALVAIKKATVDGRVCDDVAWFDGITTLHDFCDEVLSHNENRRTEMSLSRAAIFAESMGYRSVGNTPEGWHAITSATHPRLFEAMDAITHDGGGGCHEHYNAPAGWAEALPRMEAMLGRLSPEQRETLAIGECSDADALVLEFDGLAVAHRFLNAFFEDFIERESVDAA